MSCNCGRGIQTYRNGTSIIFYATGNLHMPADSSNIFNGLTALTAINLGGVSMDTTAVVNAANIFANCIGLTTLDLSGMNLQNVQNLSAAFYGCTNLISLSTNGILTSTALTNISDLFNSCTSLTSIDVTWINTTNVSEYVSIFYNCSALTTLDVSS